MTQKMTAQRKMLFCSGCLKYYRPDAFYESRQTLCKMCVREESRRWRIKNRAKHRKDSRDWRLNNLAQYRENQKRWKTANKDYAQRNKFGLSKVEFQRLLDKFHRQCFMCQSKRHLCVDHNHRSNKVRGILCSNCNRALGLVHENKLALKRAVVYLQRYDSV
jgi:hypothetical protein